MFFPMYTNWLVLVLLLLVQSPMTETREHQPKPPTCTSDGDCKISLHLRSSVCFKGSCFECLNDTNCKKGTYCDSYCDLTTHTVVFQFTKLPDEELWFETGWLDNLPFIL
eukprot:TRINITY_DN1711_c0_g1_i1.p1 TRINITY_DN1711_c0_g1~~TRINITY_DN1711_c0_g1_i1.p1  ORF type:complete len:110 (+),score=6.44 TRINITY_DN1711_c0_g1_i1:53-382(+)